MSYFELRLEVAGEPGNHSVEVDTDKGIQLKRLHFEFNYWPFDPIVDCIGGGRIVTVPLKKAIQAIHATGVSFGPVEISKSDSFDELAEMFNKNERFPDYAWLQIFGIAGHDDFGLSSRNRPVVSDRILGTLQAAGMSHCEIHTFQPGMGTLKLIK